MVIFEKMMPQERETCAALAARAFNDYEYFTDYVPDDKKRSRFLNTMLQIEVRKTGRFIITEVGRRRGLWRKPDPGAVFLQPRSLCKTGNEARWFPAQKHAFRRKREYHCPKSERLLDS